MLSIGWERAVALPAMGLKGSSPHPRTFSQSKHPDPANGQLQNSCIFIKEFFRNCTPSQLSQNSTWMPTPPSISSPNYFLTSLLKTWLRLNFWHFPCQITLQIWHFSFPRRFTVKKLSFDIGHLQYAIFGIFRERKLTFTFAICYRPSVCSLSVTFVHHTQPVEIFGN